MPLEKSITNSILMYLNRLPNCRAEKVQGGATASGRADINACYRGRTLRIEVKTPDHKNKASEKQKHNLDKWLRAGAVVMIVYNLEAVRMAINYLNRGYAGAFGAVDDYGCDSKVWIPHPNGSDLSWSL